MQVSVFSEFGVTNQPVKNSNVKANIKTSSLKQDTIEISQTNSIIKKENAKYFAGVIGAVALIAGIIHFVKKGETPKDVNVNANKVLNSISENAAPKEIREFAASIKESVTKFAQDIKTKEEQVCEELTTLFKNDGMKDSKQVLEIREIEEGYSEMVEFNQDGSILRASRFKDGKLDCYWEKPVHDADGNFSAAKQVNFEDGKINLYVENSNIAANGDVSGAKELIFDNDFQLAEYNENYVKLADGSKKYGKTVEIANDGTYKYWENYEDDIVNGTFKYGKKIEVNDQGQPFKYTVDYEQLYGTEKIGKELKYDELNS